jgi:hypothetical protein
VSYIFKYLFIYIFLSKTHPFFEHIYLLCLVSFTFVAHHNKFYKAILCRLILLSIHGRKHTPYVWGIKLILKWNFSVWEKPGMETRRYTDRYRQFSYKWRSQRHKSDYPEEIKPCASVTSALSWIAECRTRLPLDYPICAVRERIEEIPSILSSQKAHVGWSRWNLTENWRDTSVELDWGL